MTLRTRTIAAAVTAALASLGAAQTASAYSFTSSAGGPPVPVGTAFTLKGGALTLQNAATGANFSSCTGSTLSGVTAGDGVDSTRLEVTGGSYTGCKIGSQNLFWTVRASAAAPWAIEATGGLSGTFTGEVRDVFLTIRCGTSTAPPFNYTGTLTSGVSFTNGTGGLVVDWTSAGVLTASGSGCPVKPSTAALTQKLTTTSVGGSPVSPTNNLWLNP